jgi:uncharacterized SAM-binding protein YcdF (DUF218 family)
MTAYSRILISWLGRIALFLGLVVLLAAGMIAKDGFTDRVWPADAVVVLGGRVNPDGLPSPWLKARLDRALELYREGISRNIIVSGMAGKDGFNEARVMQAYLARNGVPEAHIWLDNSADTTWDSAQQVSETMRQQGWGSAVLVSQFYHLPRATLAFQRAGVAEVGSSPADGFFPGDLPGLLGEVLAYPYYWFSTQ